MSMRTFARLLAPLERRIKLLATRAVVRLVDPGAFLQLLQVEALAGELLDGVEHLEPYGYTSHPHPGAEALLLSLGGRRAHAVVVSVADRRYRLKGLVAGEVALYDDQGNQIVFRRDQLEITAVQHLVVTAPTVAIAADVSITGDVTVTGDVVADGISLKSHTHPGDSGGTTGPPQ
jgi:phage gp45-like